MSTNIYGGKGKMPHFRGEEAINGGLPQLGDMELHLYLLDRDLKAIFDGVVDTYEGYCLLDYEHWRADWNSTSWQYREKSLHLTNGSLALAIHDYEAATRLFMTETIKKTKETIPGCKVGWYGYPRNNLPLPTSITDSISWKNWCSWHDDVTSPNPQEGYPDGYPDGRTCWFEDSGYDSTSDLAAVAAQRSINDGLGWLFEMVDFITPSVYLGYEGHSPEEAESYVRSTVEEARRLADEAGSRTGLPRPEVVPQTWARYNEQQAPRIRNYVSPEDARVSHVVPLQSGADKILMWGSVNDESENENDKAAALKTWLIPHLPRWIQRITIALEPLPLSHLMHQPISHPLRHLHRHLMHYPVHHPAHHLHHHLMHQPLSQAVHQHSIHAVTAHTGATRVTGESASRQQAPPRGPVVVLRGIIVWKDVHLHIQHTHAG